MMAHRTLSFLRHQMLAKTKYGVHSPFVFEFVTQVLKTQPCPADRIAAQWRKELAQENRRFEIEDFGAGYGGNTKKLIHKTAAEVLHSSARKPKEGGLLYRMCAHYQPTQCLELGTNLGFSTLYQALGAPQAQLITIEGATALAAQAQTLLSSAGCKQVSLLQGEFYAVLQQIDWQRFRPSHVLIDGNHREAPTYAYFEYLVHKVADGAMIVFDDIYWSKGMTQAWHKIIAHPDVSVSMDLWHLGICVIRRPQAKEHFRIRF
jgi:predicted O-methyltransferase YrrM